jgi:dTDP-glucose 4,6-dehydratase
MRVLITGAAGFIGSNFTKAAVVNNGLDFSKILLLDKIGYAGNLQSIQSIVEDKRVTFIQGDIQDHELIRGLFGQIDLVVNFAAESHVDRSIDSSMPFIKSNVVGLVTLLENLRDFPSVKFVHISTDEVYGSVELGESSESDLLKPNSPYSSSKAAGDLICRSYFETYGLDIMLTRCTNNYGYFQHPEKFIPRAITNLLLGKRI